MSRLLPLALLFASILANAQIYRTVDEQGNVVFTDQPPTGSQAEEVQLRETNRVEAPATSTTDVSQTGDGDSEAQGTPYNIAIIAPENETTIPMGPGDFSVSAMVRPTLGGAHQLQLLLDGAPRGAPQKEASWALTNIDRGVHDISIAVIDREGNQVAVSSPTRVYVMRPSLNNPVN